MTFALAVAFALAGALFVLTPLFRSPDAAWRQAEEERWFGPPRRVRRARELLSADAREDRATGKLDEEDYRRLLSDAEGEEDPQGEG